MIWYDIVSKLSCKPLHDTGLSFKVDADRNPKPNLLLPTSISSLQTFCDLLGKVQIYSIQLATNAATMYIY